MDLGMLVCLEHRSAVPIQQVNFQKYLDFIGSQASCLMIIFQTKLTVIFSGKCGYFDVGCNKCICKRVLSARSVQPGTNFRAVHAFSEAALLLGIAWSRCSQSLITLLPFPGCTCFDAHTRQAGDSCSIDYKLNNCWSRADGMYFGSNELPSQYPQIDWIFVKTSGLW